MLTDEEFRLFRNMIYDESGMYLKEAKKDFLEHRVQKRMQATGTATPYWYFRYVAANRDTELPSLLDAMTINETSFFRNPPQIDLFRTAIVKDLLAQKSATAWRKLRIWSAGCSTGEEPYTIAICLLEAIPDPEKWDIKIFASDLSLKALEIANRAVYAEPRVKSNVPDELLPKYFDRVGDTYRVKDNVKRLVVFDYHNLKHENGLTALDAIFCRNVMIYFDEGEQKRVVEKFYRSLNPGGYLLIGHAESLQGMHTHFRFFYQNKGTAYQKPAQEGA